MAQQTPGKQLYDILSTRNFENLKALDSKTSKPPLNDRGQEDVSAANMFTFDWQSEAGKDYGTVVILLGADKNLEIYFGDNLGKTMEPEDKQEWFDFLAQLKNFSVRNFLGFGTSNLNRLRYSLQGQAAISEGLFESWSGNKTTSWNGKATEARLMIRHKKQIGEGDARYRYIESLFIETEDGERHKLGFTKLSGGRAMLEHVRMGGKPYDLRGQHITNIVEELNVLSRFKRANHGKIFEGDTEQLVTETNLYYENLNRVLKGLGTNRGYGRYFESWTPNEITEQDVVIEGIKHLFVTQDLDTRIEQALPVLAKIQKQGQAMKEANIFEAWVNRLAEGTWALPDTPEKQDKLIALLSREFPVGPDATNATEQLYDLVGDDQLFDDLQELAAENGNADVRELVIARLQEFAGDPDVDAVLSQISDPTAGELDDTQAPEQDMAEGEVYDLGREYGAPPPEKKKRSQDPDDHNPYPFSPEEDDDYFREIFRKKREAKDQGVAEGRLTNFDNLSDAELIRLAHRGYISGNLEYNHDGYLVNRDEIIRLLKATDDSAEENDDDFMEQGVAEGVPIATTPDSIDPGGATDNFKQQMANNTEIAYQKKLAGVAEGSGCNMTSEGESCPVHGMAECYGMGSGAASTTGNPPLEEQRREGDALLARIKSLAMVR